MVSVLPRKEKMRKQYGIRKEYGIIRVDPLLHSRLKRICKDRREFMKSRVEWLIERYCEGWEDIIDVGEHKR